MPSHFQRAFFVSLLALCLGACADKAASPGGAAASDGRGAAGGGRAGRGGGGAVPVLTAKAVKKSVPLTLPAVGAGEALSTVQVRAQVTGQLSQIHFSEGQDVKKGQLLFTIDPRPFETALAQAEAVLARDTATANNAQSQRARSEDLYKRGLIPRDQYETASAGAEALQATLQADRAAVDSAKLNLQYTRITAPISGRTGSLNLHEGDLVRANDATPLLVINQMSPIYVTFSIPGRYLADIRRYQAQNALSVEARVQPGTVPPPGSGAPGTTSTSGGAAPADAPVPGTPVPVEVGKVTFIDNAVDPTTGTIKLKATFPNTSRTLWPGLFVQVGLQLTTNPNAIVVPATAVQTSQQGQYVYVIKPDRTAELRNVQIDRQQGEETIIAQGLSAGEEVVTDGHLRLTPGARVTVPGESGEGGRRGAGAAGAGAGGPGAAGAGAGGNGRRGTGRGDAGRGTGY
jgi:membrane fusion protein, multidrug efflux system